MNTFDMVIIGHLIIQSIWAIVYVFWQFEYIKCSERTMQTVINYLNVIETIVLILTLFLEYGSWGTFGLGAWYVINTSLLIMQFSLSDWGPLSKIKDILWIVFYVYLFLIDVCHIDVIQLFINKYGQSFIVFGEVIKDTYWGDILKAIIIFIVKFIFNILFKNKGNKEYDDD